jgi:Nucleotidyl transferase AbiEii toxin, Type IV TA system
MKTVAPRLETLPTSQRNLWPKLSSVGDQFVLYGGTALSLQLGGRQSIDFDFFTPGTVDAHDLSRRLPFLSGAFVLQRANSTATFSVNCPEPVKVSFSGGLDFGRVDEPRRFSDNGVLVAGLLDLAAQKVKVVQQRAEKKDYLDVCVLLRNGVSLEKALGAAQSLHPEFNPVVTLKALTYFDDGDLGTLDASTKSQLAAAASNIREIPPVAKIDKSLLPTGRIPLWSLDQFIEKNPGVPHDKGPEIGE